MAMALMIQELNAANFSSTGADSGDVLTADGSGGAAWQAPSGGGGLPYLVYVATLTQTGTNAPVANVLANTLGGQVVWTREFDGGYMGVLNGAFPGGKTWTSINAQGDDNATFWGASCFPYAYPENFGNAMLISTQGDGSIFMSLEIRVYP